MSPLYSLLPINGTPQRSLARKERQSGRGPGPVFFIRCIESEAVGGWGLCVFRVKPYKSPQLDTWVPVCPTLWEPTCLYAFDVQKGHGISF